MIKYSDKFNSDGLSWTESPEDIDPDINEDYVKPVSRQLSYCLV
jgi:hypothetical protein